MQPDYVFIVGLPRTGTKLMMNIVENCQEKQCFITPENFFLGRFLKRGVRHQLKNFGDLNQDENIKQLVAAMYRQKFYGQYWDDLASGKLPVDKETMMKALLASDRSEQAIYSTLLQVHAPIANSDLMNIILGDKSGPHLYYVPTLLKWFPHAKVIHTLRDPRAVMASEHKKLLLKQERRIMKAQEAGRSGEVIQLKLFKPILSLMIVLYITIAWLYAARLDAQFKKRYPNNYYLSKFEDLVSDPENSVKQVCQFLGISFHPTMLEPPKIDSSYTSSSSTSNNDTGFDTQTLNRWRSYLKPWMSSWLILFGKRYLRNFGYL